jgi:HlyD family secretion protein
MLHQPRSSPLQFDARRRRRLSQREERGTPCIRFLKTQWLQSRIATAAIVAAALILAGCHNNESGPEVQPLVRVQAQPAKQGAMRQIVTADAVVFPAQQAIITPKISAPVSRFFVNRGNRVRRGELLAELENRDLKAAVVENQGVYEQAQQAYRKATIAGVPEEVRTAELDVQNTKQQLDNAQKLYQGRQNLFQQGAIPRRDLETAQAGYVQARNAWELATQRLNALQSVGRAADLKTAAAQLEEARGKYMQAEANLGYTEIRSPIDGVVTERPLYPGELATPSSPLLVVMNLATIIAKAHIPEDSAALLKQGDPVTLVTTLGVRVPATISLVSPALDPGSTTVEVWATAKNNARQFAPGASCTLQATARTLPGTLMVPEGAVFTAPDGSTTVMTVQKSGENTVARVTPVKTGVRQGGQVQIVSGLQPGQMVITSGGFGLDDKTPVKVVSTPAGAGSPGTE